LRFNAKLRMIFEKGMFFCEIIAYLLILELARRIAIYTTLQKKAEQTTFVNRSRTGCIKPQGG